MSGPSNNDWTMNNNVACFVVLNNECPVLTVHHMDCDPDEYNPDCDPDKFFFHVNRVLDSSMKLCA